MFKSLSVSLRTYFAATFALLIIALTAFLSLTISNRSTEQLQHEIGHALAGNAFQMADKLDHYMWSRAGEVNILSRLDTLRHASDPADVRELLEQLRLNFPAFSWIGFTDADGTVLAATDALLEGADISSRPVYTEALEKPFIGDVHEAVLLASLLPNPTGELLQFVDISTPVWNDDGTLRGVLATHLSWAWASEIRSSVLTPLTTLENHEVEVLIISATDNTILLGPEELIGQPLHLTSIEEARAGRTDWRIEQWPDGQEYLTGYTYGNGYGNYEGLGWTVLVREPKSTAFAPAEKLRNFILLLGAASSVLFAALGWLLAGAVASPLQRMSKAADRLRSGQKTDIPLLKGIRDIEILSTSLRELIATLARTESALGVMEGIAHHDRLTGLYNRSALEAYLPKALDKAASDNSALIFLYLDLDRFKHVNDTLGHPAGDALLREVAERLTSMLRNEDFLCRIGGDEFVLLLPGTSDDPTCDARALAERIIHALGQPFHIEGHHVEIGCSLGGAVWPNDEQEQSNVIRCADQALYHAKNTGKNKVVFYSELPWLSSMEGEGDGEEEGEQKET